MTILIVEDDIGLAELMTEIVTDLGYDYFQAFSVREAIGFLEKEMPYLMILDYNLPDMNGIDFIKKFKSFKKEIPDFIVTTGQGDERIAVEMMKLGAKDYVVKDGNFLGFLPEAIKRASREIDNESMRILMEEALKKSESYNRLLFNKSPIGLALFKFDGTLVDINIAYSSILGRTIEETKLLDYWEITPKKYYKEEIKQLKILKKTGKFGPFEKEYIHKDGYLVPVKLSGLIIEQNGENLIWTSVEDETERKRAETSLKESEELFRTLASSTSTAIFIYNTESILFANKASQDLSGYSLQEILKLKFWDFIHEDFRQIIIDRAKARLSGESVPNRYEFVLKTKENKEIWVDFTAGAIMWKGQNAAIGSAIDISDRKLAEQALKENETKFRLIAENTADTIAVFDMNLNYTYISPSLINLLGYTPDELTALGVYHIMTPESLEKIQQLFQEEMINEMVGNENPNRNRIIITEQIKKDGTKIWVEGTLSFIRNNEGKATNILAISKDITARKLAEDELRIAKEKAEESDRLKSAFLANMSHEIRTPMNGILGFSQLLKDPKLSGKDQKEFIDIIEKSGQRMLNIINDIIDISKIESGQMDVIISETNINDQIQDIYNFFKPEVEFKGMMLLSNLKLDYSQSTILTDKEKFYAVIVNLVKNAIKYTDKGFIEIGYNLKNDYLEFYVKDTGIGIPYDRQKAIFERFVQADITDKRALQGAGLGLAISNAYVKMLKGKMWVESEEGKGSTFFFSIPYKHNNTLPAKVSEYIEDIAVKEMKKLKILIAEDDQSSVKLLCFALKSFSKEIMVVNNGWDAIRLLKENPDIDLVLMDIKMPEINGFETTKKIREFNKNVIIIAQTAYGMTSDKEKALEFGCNDYLSKPIHKNNLMKMMDKYFSD